MFIFFVYYFKIKYVCNFEFCQLVIFLSYYVVKNFFLSKKKKREKNFHFFSLSLSCCCLYVKRIRFFFLLQISKNESIRNFFFKESKKGAQEKKNVENHFSTLSFIFVKIEFHFLSLDWVENGN